MISGTPALNKPIEMFTALSLLIVTTNTHTTTPNAPRGANPKPVLNLKAYGERYCAGGRPNFGQYNGASNKDELYALLTNTVMIRRKKADVLGQLPAKIRTEQWITCSPDDMKRLDPLKVRRKEIIPESNPHSLTRTLLPELSNPNSLTRTL